jgi:sugar phosphate isomerase/epimerase
MVEDARLGFVVQLGMDDETAISFAGDAGFDFVELLLDGDSHRTRLDDRVEEIRTAAADAGVGLLVHLPFGGFDIGSPHDHVRDGSIRELEAALDTAASLGAEKAVLHASTNAWGPAWDEETLTDRLFESIRRLDEYARRQGVECCVENIPYGVVDTNDFPELFERTDASMTFDTGHARMDGRDDDGLAAFCRDYGDRISHVHLNDTRGSRDEHLPIGAGTIDFEKLFESFPAGWDGTISLEVFTLSYAYLRASKDHFEECVRPGDFDEYR